MEFSKTLKASLEDVIASSKSLLRYLEDTPQSAHPSGCGPADPFAQAPSDVNIARQKLAEGSTKLVQLATSSEEYLDHLANNYQELTCVRWLVDLNILTYLPEQGSISYSALASRAGVPEKQLKSVARMAVINGFLQENSPDQVSHGRASSLLIRDDNFMSWARWMVNYSIPVALKLADATRKWGDTDAKDQTAYQIAMNTTEPFFDSLRKSPELTSLFSGYMRNVTASWPWSLQHAVDGFDWASLPHGSTVVDIGGSHGQLAVQVARKIPHLKFIIQDLPETVATAQKSFDADASIEDSVRSRITFMPHDFFQPQPVVDAKVYFLRMIIHDWPDKDALVILKHLQAALDTNPTAQVVMMDTVLPPPGTVSTLQERQLRVRDLMMMSVFNAKERELEDWNGLAERSGMQVTNVHQPRDSVMALLTARRVQSNEAGAHVDPIATRADSPMNDTVIGVEKPVIIAGAGISGLCLAQGLKKANIPFLVFERDPAVDSRPQGYRLKLEAGGAQALFDCLPADIYREFETSCAVTAVGETDFSPFTGQIIKSRRGGGLSGSLGLNPSYTVDRRAFRKALMRGIEDRVTFGKELRSYDTDTEKQTVTCRFKDGSVVEGRLLVGTDGLNSVVRRQQMPTHTLVDTEAVCVYGKTPLTPEVTATFPKEGLRWMTVVSDSAPMLQSCLIGEAPVTVLVEPIRFSTESRQHNPDLPADYLYWAFIGSKQRFGVTTNNKTSGMADKKATSDSVSCTLSLTEEWHPSIRCLFEQQDHSQATTIQVASSIPEIPTWESSALVTLLGDAVHPMSPCGGVGANTALCDAADLTKVLANIWKASGDTAIKEIEVFESDMRNRAFRSILRSEIGSKKMFGMKDLVKCDVLSGSQHS